MIEAARRARPPRPRWLLAMMTGYTAAGVLLLVPTGMMALMSPMPGSTPASGQ